MKPMRKMASWFSSSSNATPGSGCRKNTEISFVSWFSVKFSLLNTSNMKVKPTNIYLFKLNNRNSGERCEIRSKLTIKIAERRKWRHNVVLVSLFALNIFHTFSYCFYCWLWTGKCLLGITSLYWDKKRKLNATRRGKMMRQSMKSIQINAPTGITDSGQPWPFTELTEISRTNVKY